MKILVPVKRAVDYRAKISVKADPSGVDLAKVKIAMKVFDAIVVEQALKFKPTGKPTVGGACIRGADCMPRYVSRRAGIPTERQGRNHWTHCRA